MLNLDQWLSFIEAGHPEEIDLGLERTLKVALELGVRDMIHPVVTVAGTNGKGSTIAYMSEILKQAGVRVGCYTSPHFLRYNERITINDQPVEDQLLCDSFARIENARSKADVPLTYFEFGTLVALDIFNRQAIDVVLLEVGLGGRLDAVNIVDPDVAVVTTVALDHESWLGNDRETIGREKAGIFRSGRPAVFGEADVPQSVVKHAADIGADLMVWGCQFGPVQTDNTVWSWRGRDRTGEEICINNLVMPSLPFSNGSTAIQALKMLDLAISDDAFRKGIEKAQLTGRFQQVVKNNRQVVLDVAHNPHAAENLAKQISSQAFIAEYSSSGDADRNTDCSEKVQVHCVVGMLEDKDVRSTLKQLSSVVDQWYPATLHVPRGQTAVQLNQALESLGLVKPGGRCFNTVSDAFNHALENSGSRAVILVVGSFYTVADVLKGCLEA
ncbi:bifunctional tetrahydrofolate synthase/dihydrofolate synthase [Motiliproteus sp. MSK22-1]|uniref:bifunctional tetrahydrofolate synthase/dihydrofolate synthase n=1 Tax=Motiliproteus sp. MSK22-1 TaxID=1897630 RepID=UPI001E65D97E|nr:bifunctional tetrahydrofolate synthase/dihydrofolate synthase [Motiliproteus sp. MSK22-1]